MKKIFLHIGTPKTATTYLQKLFSTNNDKLQDSGILYPLSGRYENQDKHLQIHHIISVLSKSKGYKLKRFSSVKQALINQRITERDIVRGVEKEALSANIDTLILSCENLWKLDKWKIKKLKETLGGFDVTPIVYLRRQDLFLDSISTNLMMTSNIDSFKKKILNKNSQYRKSASYSDIISLWGKFFGGNIIVRRFQKESLKNGDIVDDFFSAIGFHDVANSMVRPNNENESLSRDGLIIKSMVNALVYDESLPNPLAPSKIYIPAIKAFMDNKNCGNYSIFTRKESEDLRNLFDEQNKKIAKKYFPGEGERLFSDAASSKKPLDDYPGFDDRFFIEFLNFLSEYDERLYSEISTSLCSLANREALRIPSL